MTGLSMGSSKKLDFFWLITEKYIYNSNKKKRIQINSISNFKKQSDNSILEIIVLSQDKITNNFMQMYLKR